MLFRSVILWNYLYIDKKVNTDALSGYWMKSNGNSGNGSPKYEVETNNKYNVTFTRTDAGYVAEFTSLGKPLQVDANGVAKYSDKKELVSTPYTRSSVPEKVSCDLLMSPLIFSRSEPFAARKNRRLR